MHLVGLKTSLARRFYYVARGKEHVYPLHVRIERFPLGVKLANTPKQSTGAGHPVSHRVIQYLALVVFVGLIQSSSPNVISSSGVHLALKANFISQALWVQGTPRLIGS